MRVTCSTCKESFSKGSMAQLPVLGNRGVAVDLVWVCRGCKKKMKTPKSPKKRRLTILKNAALLAVNTDDPVNLRGEARMFADQMRGKSAAERQQIVDTYTEQLRRLTPSQNIVRPHELHLPAGVDRYATRERRNKREKQQRDHGIREERRRRGGRPPKDHRETERRNRKHEKLRRGWAAMDEQSRRRALKRANRDPAPPLEERPLYAQYVIEIDTDKE